LRGLFFVSRPRNNDIHISYSGYYKLKLDIYLCVNYTAQQHSKFSRIEEEYQMTIFNIIYPVQAALPYVRTFFGSASTVARPLFGLGALMSVLMLFKPLLLGVLQAIRLVFSPRLSLEQRNEQRTLRGVLILNRMARDLDQSQPNQAAELRMLASRT
jgi:hypothetical protein